MTTHKRLRNMTASSGNTSATQSHTQDCSICLNSIAVSLLAWAHAALSPTLLTLDG